MMGFSQTTLLGNVTRDLELKSTNNGKDVVSITLAVTRGEQTSFIDCVAWNEAAKTLAKYVKKGDPLFVSGSLSQRSFEVGGQKRSKVEVMINQFVFLQRGKKEDGPITQNEVLEKAGDFVPQDVDDKPIDLSEIPF